jgi:ribosome-binding protein aMBF1 (putative translation factor)
MTIGEHIMLLRKQKGFSQAALGKEIGTSGDIIGRYERNIMTPSIGCNHEDFRHIRGFNRLFGWQNQP